MKRLTRASFIKTITGGVSVQQVNNEVVATTAVSDNTPKRMLTTGINPYVGVWGKVQTMHLLRRSMFGVTQADFQHFSKKPLFECLDILFKTSSLVLPPNNYYNDDKYIDPDVPFGQTWVTAPFGDQPGETNFRRDNSLKAWLVENLIKQKRSLEEKMILFWHNHFGAQIEMIKESRYSYQYHTLLRSNVFGNFKKLTREITTNPGMLQYLNGNTSTAVAANENYARELQELFTMGKGPDSHYTEDDVKAAARVLTGWKDNGITLSADFHPDLHDTNNKQFSEFYGNTVIAGRQGVDGVKEIDDLLNMIFKKREVAKFLCRKLYRWFVYYDIDDTIEKNVISPLAEIFIKNNFEVLPVVRALLASEHFFDPQNMGCQIKNPPDVLIGACRQFQAGFPKESTPSLRTWALYKIGQSLKDMGMALGDPPNVAGWTAYYQAPGYYHHWINSATMRIRNETSDLLCNSAAGLYYNGGNIKFDLLAFTASLSNPGDPNKLIADSTFLLFPVTIDATQISFLKNILLSQQLEDHYWTDAWRDYVADPTNESNKSVVRSRLEQYYTYIAGRAEYQLM